MRENYFDRIYDILIIESCSLTPQVLFLSKQFFSSYTLQSKICQLCKSDLKSNLLFIKMSENQEETTKVKETPEEIAEVIAELEQYRSRIVNDTMAMAKRAKVLRASALANIENHPEIAKIDAMLTDLHSRKAADKD